MERETAVYKRDEFIETAVKRGYATRGISAIYTDNNPKTVYTEEDLQELWRFQDRAKEEDDPYGVFNCGLKKSYEEKKDEERERWMFGGGTDPVKRDNELRKERYRKRKYDDDPYLI